MLTQKRIRSFEKEIGDLHFTSIRPSVDDIDPASDILIYNVDKISPDIKDFIDGCREKEFVSPMIVITHIPHKPLEFDFIENVAILRKPFENSEFSGLITYLLGNRNALNRRFPRYPITEKAVIEGYQSDYRSDATILNISKGGVLIKGFSGVLKPNDVLRIQFNLNKINKERTLSSRVVWVEQEANLAGLEFINSTSVYKYLLNNTV